MRKFIAALLLSLLLPEPAALEALAPRTLTVRLIGNGARLGRLSVDFGRAGQDPPTCPLLLQPDQLVYPLLESEQTSCAFLVLPGTHVRVRAPWDVLESSSEKWGSIFLLYSGVCSSLDYEDLEADPFTCEFVMPQHDVELNAEFDTISGMDDDPVDDPIPPDETPTYDDPLLTEPTPEPIGTEAPVIDEEPAPTPTRAVSSHTPMPSPVATVRSGLPPVNVMNLESSAAVWSYVEHFGKAARVKLRSLTLDRIESASVLAFNAAQAPVHGMLRGKLTARNEKREEVKIASGEVEVWTGGRGLLDLKVRSRGRRFLAKRDRARVRLEIDFVRTNGKPISKVVKGIVRRRPVHR